MSGETTNNYLKRLFLYPLILLRIPNIIIVAITIWVFATAVVYPRLLEADILPVLSMKDLYLLVFIVGCIAAGGYLLNDIIDVDTDRANNKRAYINTGLERILAFITYFIITIAPIPFAYSLASEIDKVQYIPLYFIAVILLAAYNIYLKKLPVVGNVLVALLCVGVIWIFLLAEEQSLQVLQKSDPASYNYIYGISLFYYVFSFCANLGREIIKDIQDINGDKAVDAHTLPIVFGVKGSVTVVIAILLSLILFITWWAYVYIPSAFGILFAVMLIGLPLVILLYYLIGPKVEENISKLSSGFKIWMLLGLLFIYINAI